MSATRSVQYDRDAHARHDQCRRYSQQALFRRCGVKRTARALCLHRLILSAQDQFHRDIPDGDEPAKFQ